MTTPDTTEDFTAASPDSTDGSAKWLGRLPVPRPLRLPLRRKRALDTAPFEPASPPAVDARAPSSNGHLEPTHRLEGFDLRSVASTALLYYACAFVALASGVILVWVGASTFGVIGRVEEFMRSIGFRGFHFAGLQIVMGGLLLCVAAVAFLTVMTILAAAFYNLLGRPGRGRGLQLRLAPIEPMTAWHEPSVDGMSNGNGSHGNGSDGNGSDGAEPR